MIRNVFRGNSSRVFLVLVALSSLAAGWWLRDELSMRTQSASAEVTQCKELVRTFDAYPLLYLGDSFEGLPLNYCVRRQSAAIANRNPATDRFVFVYGRCTIEPGQSSCPAPLQVTIYPPCGSAFPGAHTPGDRIRGSEAKVVGAASVLVETPRYRVKVSPGTDNAADAALVRRAFVQLRGANPLADRLTAGKPLADPALVDAPAKDKDACRTGAAVGDGQSPFVD